MRRWRARVPLLGPLAEVYLLLVGEQLSLADVRQVLGEKLRGLRFPLHLRAIQSLVL